MCRAKEPLSDSDDFRISNGFWIPFVPSQAIIFPPRVFVSSVNSPVMSNALTKSPKIAL